MALLISNVTGAATVRSGATGQARYQILGEGSLDLFGHARAVLGDLDADGVPDCAFGALQTLPNGMSSGGTGHVKIVSGRSGALQRRLDDFVARSGFDLRLAALGDVDGDTVADLAVGAPFETGGGASYLISLSSGAPIRRHAPTQIGQQLGYDVAALGDLDGDCV